MPFGSRVGCGCGSPQSVRHVFYRMTNTSVYQPGTYKHDPALASALKSANAVEALKEAAKNEGAA